MREGESRRAAECNPSAIGAAERGAKSGLIDCQIPRAQNGLFGVRAADLRHQPRPGNQWCQWGKLSVYLWYLSAILLECRAS